MGAIASKYAFLPPNSPKPLHADCKMLHTSDSIEIPSYFVKHEASQFVVIYSHGNAEDLTSCVAFCNQISSRFRVSVFAYEYIGYPHTRNMNPSESLSPSFLSSSVDDEKPSPSESGCYESIQTAYKYVRDSLGYDEAHQIWFGQSVGSGPTVDLVARLGAKKINLAGMILLSPFYSGVSTVSPFLSNFVDIFCNGAKMPKVTCPTLIIHGAVDDVVPVGHSSQLEMVSHCRINRCVVPNAGHNNLFQFQATFAALKDFFKQITDE